MFGALPDTGWEQYVDENGYPSNGWLLIAIFWAYIGLSLLWHFWFKDRLKELRDKRKPKSTAQALVDSINSHTPPPPL